MRPQFQTMMVQKDGKLLPTQVTVTVAVTVKLDGKAVRAFAVDGKELAAADVAKRLAKPAPAVVFHAAPPDPCYLQFLREGTPVFVVPRQQFFAQGMAPGAPPVGPPPGAMPAAPRPPVGPPPAPKAPPG